MTVGKMARICRREGNTCASSRFTHKVIRFHVKSDARVFVFVLLTAERQMMVMMVMCSGHPWRGVQIILVTSNTKQTQTLLYIINNSPMPPFLTLINL